MVFIRVAVSPPVLSVCQRLSLGERAPPTSLAFDAEGRLWTVAGAVQEIETGDAAVTEQVRSQRSKGGFFGQILSRFPFVA